MSRTDTKMSTVDLAEEAGALVAAELRARHPRHTEELVAREIGAKPRTVRAWLGGRIPSSRFLLRMLAIYDPDFRARVLSPCGPWAEALAADVADLRAMRARLDDLADALDRAIEQQG